MKEKIETMAAPAALGPYSQAIKQGNMVFTSGTIPLDANGECSADITVQTRQALNNLKAILDQSGAEMADVVKVTCFIKDMDQFTKINEVYGEFFPQPYPARSCVEVARLPKDVGVEIEAIAIVK
jgi:2-iminobutanoate/2-iminopropanoate deaminase